MTPTVKTLPRLLPLGVLLLIVVVYRTSNNSGYADNADENAAGLQVIRRRRTIGPASIYYCKFNQYYDQEEGRCLGVPGGGKVVHVENRRSCGVNVLRPHCKSPLYYHICKRDKSILAQCANRQIFDNRLQRCAYYDPSKLTPSVIPPDSYMYYDHVRVPGCTMSGRFPVLGHCSMFYTCDTNGHRFYQSVFKCPQNTGYLVDRGVCNVALNCPNDNSVDAVCVPNAPGESVESLSLDEAAGRSVDETPEIFEEGKAGADDPVVEREKDSKILDVVVTTPGSIIDTQLENNYNDNDRNTDVSSNNENLSESVKQVSVPDGVDEEIVHSQVPNLPEIVQGASDERRNEETGPSPPTTELDDVPHSITTSTTSTEPEYRTNADVGSETIDTAPFPESQDVTTESHANIGDSAIPLSNFNAEPTNPVSTMSNAPESSSIRDVLPNMDEIIQGETTEQYKNNEDGTSTLSNFNTDSVNLYSAPTVSDASESSPISDLSPNIDDKMQNAATEQYGNNEDSTVIPQNSNTDSVEPYSAPTLSDAPESSPISDVSSNINEKLQDEPTGQYGNNEDSVASPINFNTDSVDPYSAPALSDVPESSPTSDVSSNINEKLQDEPTGQYGNNEDSVASPTNFNTDSVDSAPTLSDVPESSPMSDALPNIGEKIQDAATEQYRNNEDNVSNFNSDSVNPTLSNIPESSPIDDASSKLDEEI
ncbi:PREDICTED: flocculation protein FLO11-like [Vollenhovia emeryi]|uniref:flocculation protein FLO11-like n=1 Tax=Vollenhovia emeryi TaxID=411798 RepID=UPI0005F3A43F|nr:PREDICTED: flocculation protein FLO11-like [Vollenhovia emeryi]